MKIKSPQGMGKPYNPLIYCGDRFTTNNENSVLSYIGNGGLTVVTDRANGGDDNYLTPFEYSDWLNLTLTYDSGLFQFTLMELYLKNINLTHQRFF